MSFLGARTGSAAALAALAGFASVEAGPGRESAGAVVQYRPASSGLVVLDVHIDGAGPFAFLLDTGASASGVFERTVRAQADDWAGDGEWPPRTDHPPALVAGLDGVALRSLIAIGELRVAHAVQPMERLLVLPDPADDTLDGVLGMDFLDHYALVIDPGARTVEITPHEAFSDAPYRRWRRVSLHDAPGGADSRGLRFFTMRMGPDTAPALVDTGSQATILNRRAVEQMSVFRDLRRVWRRARRYEGAHGTSQEVQIAAVDEMVAGRHSWGRQRVVVLDLQGLSALGADRAPFIVAGADLLTQRGLVLDFGGESLFIPPH